MVERNEPGRLSSRQIDKLHHFQFHDAKGQAVVYLVTATIALAYAVVNDLVLRRPEQNVVLECAFLTACLLVGLTFLCGSGLTYGIASYLRRARTLSLVFLFSTRFTRSVIGLISLVILLHKIRVAFRRKKRSSAGKVSTSSSRNAP